MEDIVTVLDGRSEIVFEVQQAGEELKDHLVVTTWLYVVLCLIKGTGK